MGQAFIVRRGNNYGFKKIEAPELYTDSSAKKRYYKFPKSLFPELGYYMIIAQYRDINNAIIPVHCRVRVYGSTNTSYQITGGIELVSTVTTSYDSDYIYLGISYSTDNARYDAMKDWVFEKGFIYEYK